MLGVHLPWESTGLGSAPVLETTCLESQHVLKSPTQGVVKYREATRDAQPRRMIASARARVLRPHALHGEGLPMRSKRRRSCKRTRSLFGPKNLKTQ